jgi:lipopolysaccharide biosynthesis glycosyltransferase
MSDFVADEGGPSQHRGRRLYRVGVGKAALFFKLLLWALPPETFPRVAFIDLDVLILTNLDELLRDEHMLVAPNAIAAAPAGLACEKGSASPEHANTAFFNSGVFVFRPSLTHLHLLLLTEHHVHSPWNGYFPAMKNASWADQCSPKDDVYRFARLFNGSSNAFRDCRLHHNGSLTGRIPKACEPTLTDQSILNRVFGKRWNLLDSRFNVHRQGLLGCRFVANASEERVAEGGGAGAETSVSCKGKVVSIVHFVGEPKPWDPDRRRRSQPHGATSPTVEESAKMLYRQRCGFL